VELENWSDDMSRTVGELAMYDVSVIDQRLSHVRQRTQGMQEQTKDVSGKAQDILLQLEQAGKLASVFMLLSKLLASYQTHIVLLSV